MPYLDTTGLTRLVANLKNFLVPKTRTVNGVTLDEDITLTAANIPMDEGEGFSSVRAAVGDIEAAITSGAPGQAFMASPEGAGHMGVMRTLDSGDIPNLSALYLAVSRVGAANGVAGLNAQAMLADNLIRGMWSAMQAITDEAADWNDYTDAGLKYLMQGSLTNGPGPAYAFYVLNIRYSLADSSLLQLALPYNSNPDAVRMGASPFYRTRYGGPEVSPGIWGPWQQINTTPAIGYGAKVWASATLINGATGAVYYTRVNGIVYVRGVVMRNTALAAIIVAQLPVGFRPVSLGGYVTGAVYNNGSYNANPEIVALVNYAGNVWLEQNTAGTPNVASTYNFALSYPAEL